MMTHKQRSSQENPSKMSIMVQACKGLSVTKGSAGSKVKGKPHESVRPLAQFPSQNFF